MNKDQLQLKLQELGDRFLSQPQGTAAPTPTNSALTPPNLEWAPVRERLDQLSEVWARQQAELEEVKEGCLVAHRRNTTTADMVATQNAELDRLRDQFTLATKGHNKLQDTLLRNIEPRIQNHIEQHRAHINNVQETETRERLNWQDRSERKHKRLCYRLGLVIAVMTALFVASWMIGARCWQQLVDRTQRMQYDQAQMMLNGLEMSSLRRQIGQMDRRLRALQTNHVRLVRWAQEVDPAIRHR